MEKLRADNNHRDDKHKLYIREDLTKNRNKLHYKTRQLKKAGLIKDTFSRDGMIVVKVRIFGKPDKQYYISSDNELKNICETHKPAVDKDLKPLKGSASTEPKASYNKMDTSDAAGDAKASDKGLDPKAAVFEPKPGSSKEQEPIVKSLFSDILKSK